MGWREEMDATIMANKEAAEAKRRTNEATARALEAMFAEVYQVSTVACVEFAERLGDGVKFERLPSFLNVTDHIGFDRFTIHFDRTKERISVSDNSYGSSSNSTFQADPDSGLFGIPDVPGARGFKPSAFGDEVVGPSLFAWEKQHRLLDAK